MPGSQVSTAHILKRLFDASVRERCHRNDWNRKHDCSHENAISAREHAAQKLRIDDVPELALHSVVENVEAETDRSDAHQRTASPCAEEGAADKVSGNERCSAQSLNFGVYDVPKVPRIDPTGTIQDHQERENSGAGNSQDDKAGHPWMPIAAAPEWVEW